MTFETETLAQQAANGEAAAIDELGELDRDQREFDQFAHRIDSGWVMVPFEPDAGLADALGEGRLLFDPEREWDDQVAGCG